MDFSHFDTRKYPARSVREGYGEWAATYEDIVQDAMDLRSLARIQSVAWDCIAAGADLACGTGRIGVWLKQHEGLIDEELLAAKLKWRTYLHWPISFAMVWQK